MFDAAQDYKLKLTLSQVLLGYNRMADLITITEVSRRSGVASSALRFYENRGLIHSQRAGSGHRRYSRAVLRRVAFIVFAQKMGLSLEEIGEELAKLPDNRVPERVDREKLSASWTKRINDRIAESASAGRANPLYRVRMPFAARVPVRQRGRSRGKSGARSPLLDRWEKCKSTLRETLEFRADVFWRVLSEGAWPFGLLGSVAGDY